MKRKHILLLIVSILASAAAPAQSPLQWDQIGPKGIGGRTRAILIDRRDSTRATVYAGAVSGGLWKSTDHGANWQPVLSAYTCAAVSCIAQDTNGRIYFGTGEGLAQPDGTSRNTGSVGNGLHFLYGNDQDSILPSTMPSAISNYTAWSMINRVAINPTNPQDIYVALSDYSNTTGLEHSLDGGLTWTEIGTASAPISGLSSGYNGAADVKFSSDGYNIFASVGKYAGFYPGTDLIVSNDGGNTFSYVSNAAFPASIGRIEIGVAPSAPDSVYVAMAGVCGSCAGFSQVGIYVSADAGNTWALIGSNSGVLTNAFGTDGQGWFDNVISVNPHNADQVYFGGVQLYSYSSLSGWSTASDFTGGLSDPNWAAPDFHVIAFNDLNPDEMYTGSSGGVFRSTNATSAFPTPTYSISDNGYNVTQMYSVGADLYSNVLGGTQDEGTEYVTNNNDVANPNWSGDGSYAEISHFDSSIFVGSGIIGNIYRSADLGYSWLSPYDSVIDPYGTGSPSVCSAAYDADAPFITAFWLVETRHATNNVSKVPFADNVAHSTGDVVTVTSHIGYTFQDTLTSALPAGDTAYITDRLESRLYLATSCGLWMTPDILNFTSTPRWFRITSTSISASPSADVKALAASATGDTIFFTTPYAVTRISGLNSVPFDSFATGQSSIILSSGARYQMDTAIVTTSGYANALEGIDVDVNNPNHLLCTLAGFSTSPIPRIFESNDAGTTWTAIASSLPDMPVYQCVIDAYHSSHYIIGTDRGIWDSYDGGTTWNEQDGGITIREPVYRLRQQAYLSDGCYALYAGLHGRGMWRCTTITEEQASCPVVPLGISTATEQAAVNNMTIYPNPMDGSGHAKLELAENADVSLQIIDMTGRVLEQKNYPGLNEGSHILDINTSLLANGSYLVIARLNSGEAYTRTLIVTR